MPDFTGSLSDFAGALRGFVSLTRHGRLREQLRDCIGLFALAKEHPELQSATDDLVVIVTVLTARLRAVLEPERRRRWEWGTFFVGIGFTAGTAWVGVAIWPHRSSWWGVPALWVLASFIVIFLIVSFQSIFAHRNTTA